MAKIFIGYARSDRPDFVQWLASFLQKLPEGDISVWYDTGMAAAKGGFSAQISKEISDSDFVLVVITRGLLDQSSFVHKEIAFAQSLNKPIIPILVEDCTLPLSLADLHYIDFTGDEDIALSELIAFLRGVPIPGRLVSQMSATTRAQYHQYLKLLVQRLGLLPVGAVDILSEEQFQLSQLWTPLNTTLTEEPTEEAARRFKLPSKPVSVLDMIGREKRVVLMGDPGAGKSTALHFIALCLSGSELKDKKIAPLGLQDLGSTWTSGKLCPVYLELREFAAKGMPEADAGADHLLDYLLSQFKKSTALASFASEFQRLLGAGQCIVLFDGMDEVPESHRRRVDVLKCVREFTAMYSGCRFVVTTRTYAYRRNDWRLDNFVEAEIAPFNEIQIAQYIDQLYRAKITQRPQLQGRQEALKQEIAARPDDLGYLARRPLLLALMASIHSRIGAALPETRAVLYRDISHLLLVHWESSKAVLNPKTGRTQFAPSSLAAFLGRGNAGEELRVALSAVAFEAHKSMAPGVDEADISLEHLAFVLRKTLRRDPTGDELPSEFDIAEELRDRSGIVVAHDDDVYRFPHRSFQEYMAACYLCDDQYFPDELVHLSLEDPARWREVFIFAVGELIQGRQRYSNVWVLIDALISEVQSIGTGNPTLLQWQAVLLAGMALMVNQVPVPGRPQHRAIHQRVKEWLQRAIITEQLSPRDRLIAGQALDFMGDDRAGIGITTSGSRRVPSIVWSRVIPKAQVNLGTGYETRTVSCDPFRVSIYPITNAQYQLFIEAADGWKNPAWWSFSHEAAEWKASLEASVRPQWTEGNCPRSNITWFEAVAYCRWLGSKPGFEGVRLLTEVEWEYCARAYDQRLYSWGDRIDVDNANLDFTEVERAETLRRISPVGMYVKGVGPFGIFDLVGNVWEWCQTEYRADPYHGGDGRELLSGNQPRVVRGGSWRTAYQRALTVERGRLSPGECSNEVGFRICQPH